MKMANKEGKASKGKMDTRPRYVPPGRLGDPKMELFQDPRANAKLIEAMAEFGIERNRAPPSLATLSPNSSVEELSSSMAEAESGFEQLYEALPNDLPHDQLELEVIEEEETIDGPGDSKIPLHIFRPKLRGGPLPGVVYLHSGHMTMLKTMNKVHRRWCISLAGQGMVAIAVDFRNAWSEAGMNPFPAGLDDCCAAVQWVHANKDRLDIRNMVVQGEGGGANLALAAALKGKREGWSYKLDGVYANSPEISGAYSWSQDRKLQELPSLIECHGYFVNVDFQAYVAHVYTPRTADSTNPLAWPYHAIRRDLEGLPPHVLSMNELDPLRDEGMAYYRKLSAAGVKCTAHVNLGHTHSANLIFRQALPEDHKAAIKSVAAFAKSV